MNSTTGTSAGGTAGSVTATFGNFQLVLQSVTRTVYDAAGQGVALWWAWDGFGGSDLWTAAWPHDDPGLKRAGLSRPQPHLVCIRYPHQTMPQTPTPVEIK